MRRFLFAVLTVSAVLAVTRQARAADPAPDPAAVRQEMARIRRATNWEDPKAAAEANRRITELSQGLIRAASPGQFDATGKAKAGSQADIMAQSVKAVAAGASDADLAASVRAEVDAYENAPRDYTPRNAEMFADLETLVVDLSTPQGKATAQRLDSFKGVKHLFVIGGEKGAPIDLPSLLRKASAMPLEDLHVVGFRGFLKEVPDSIGAFTRLRGLSFINDGLRAVPASLSSLRSLEALHLDANPIATVAASVTTMEKLRTLGLRRTSVPAAELDRLRSALPRCTVEAR